VNVSPYTTYTLLGAMIIGYLTVRQLCLKGHLSERAALAACLLSTLAMIGFTIAAEQWYVTAALSATASLFVWAAAPQKEAS
jgi:hypothetical protein